MVKFSNLLVDKTLHGLGMDRCDVIRSPVKISCLSITYVIVTLVIDTVMSFYNYWTFKTFVKICVSVQSRIAGNSNSLLKMAELL